MKALVSRHRRDLKKVSVTGAGQCIWCWCYVFNVCPHTGPDLYTEKNRVDRLMVQICFLNFLLFSVDGN